MRTDHKIPLTDTRGRFVHEIEWSERPWPAAVRGFVLMGLAAFVWGVIVVVIMLARGVLS